MTAAWWPVTDEHWRVAVEALSNVMSRASEVTQAVGQMVLELLSDLLETGTFETGNHMIVSSLHRMFLAQGEGLSAYMVRIVEKSSLLTICLQLFLRFCACR